MSQRKPIRKNPPADHEDGDEGRRPPPVPRIPEQVIEFETHVMALRSTTPDVPRITPPPGRVLAPENAIVGEPSVETKELLHKLRLEQRQAADRALAEAKELERRAKELEQQARTQRRMRVRLEKHAERVRRLAPKLGLLADRPITVIPPIEDPQRSVVEQATIQEGRSYIRIVFDARLNAYEYEVIEPVLEANERTILAFLRDTLVRTLEGRPETDTKTSESVLVEAVDRAIVDHSVLIDDTSKQRVLYYLLREFLGSGPIDVLMHDPMIEDISCDGPRIPIYIFHRQYESVRTNIVFGDEKALDSYVIRLGQRSGKHISIADPLLDATLPDGSRLQASLSKEVTTRGSSFTIRRFRADPLTPPDLVRLGTIDARMAAFFWLAMSEGMSILFAGGTASGKTTTLNASSLFIPPSRKIVSIEDTRELNLPHENWIAGLTRGGFTGETVGGKAAGTIDMYKLLEAALRQRPEYLIVGEVRGPEAATLFQAMATGHATYSTLHADSAPSAVYRLENPPISVPRMMIQTLDLVAVQMQVRIGHRPVRRLKEVVEILGRDPATGDLLTNTIFQWDPATDTYTYGGASQILEEIRVHNNRTPEQVEKEWADRTLVIDWMVANGVRGIRDVASVVAEYYRRPAELMERVEETMRGTPKAEAAAVAPPQPGAGGHGA